MADSQDIGMVAKYCTEDVTIHFANSPPLEGRPSVERLYSWEYGGCQSVNHRCVPYAYHDPFEGADQLKIVLKIVGAKLLNFVTNNLISWQFGCFMIK